VTSVLHGVTVLPLMLVGFALRGRTDRRGRVQQVTVATAGQNLVPILRQQRPLVTAGGVKIVRSGHVSLQSTTHYAQL
jgi:hypothetical protein